MITIEFSPRCQDLIGAAKLYDSRLKIRRLDIAVGIVLILFGLILLKTWYGWLFILVGLAEIFHLVPTYAIRGWLDFTFNKKYKNIQRLTFGTTGLDYETLGIRSHIDWTFYESYIEGEHLFLLTYGKMLYTVVPKSAFQASDLAAFGKMLETIFQKT